MNIDGSNMHWKMDNLHEDGNHELAWSPGGEQIAFLSNLDGDYDIYILNVYGTDIIKLNDTDYQESGISWTNP